MAETAANTKSATQERTRTPFAAMGVGAINFTTNAGDLGISGLDQNWGPYHFVRLDLLKLAQTITNGASEYTNTLLFTFPIGLIQFLGAIYSLTPTTTSTLSTTITTGTTGAVAFGTAVASNATLSTTMINIGPGTGQTPTAYTSSTTVNVAAAAVTGFLIALPTTMFDGTATAIKMYLNNSIATNSADGTMAWDGYINLAYLHVGDV